jgi:hypothetical protein
VLGIHHRRLYEVIVHHGLTTPCDALAAALMSRSAGYNALAALATAGLISHIRGAVGPGVTSLDDVARLHGLHLAHAERTARHRRERAAWNTWLATRLGAHHHCGPTEEHHVLAEPWDTHDTADYLAAVASDGPPYRPPTNPDPARPILRDRSDPSAPRTT